MKLSVIPNQYHTMMLFGIAVTLLIGVTIAWEQQVTIINSFYFSTTKNIVTSDDKSVLNDSYKKFIEKIIVNPQIFPEDLVPGADVSFVDVMDLAESDNIDKCPFKSTYRNCHKTLGAYVVNAKGDTELYQEIFEAYAMETEKLIDYGILQKYFEIVSKNSTEFHIERSDTLELPPETKFVFVDTHKLNANGNARKNNNNNDSSDGNGINCLHRVFAVLIVTICTAFLW